MRENLDVSYLGHEEDDIYRLNILEHYKNPKNFGKLDHADITHKEINTTCGDEIQIFVKLDNHKKIKEARFFGKGCAISQAAASMLTEKVKGLTLEEVKKISKEEVMEMLGIKLGVVRQKCGLLCLKSIVKGIEVKEK